MITLTHDQLLALAQCEQLMRSRLTQANTTGGPPMNTTVHDLRNDIALIRDGHSDVFFHRDAVLNMLSNAQVGWNRDNLKVCELTEELQSLRCALHNLANGGVR